MANEEHLAILKQGAEIWNEWRQENKEDFLLEPDLSGADLSGMDLEKINFFRVNLNDAVLIETNLNRGKLVDATLVSANLYKASMSMISASRVNLNHANLVGARLNGSSLGGFASLQGTNLSKANLTLAYWDFVDLSDANLSEAELISANLFNANLSRAKLARTFLLRTNLTKANLHETDFENSGCASTYFCGVDLSVAKNLHLARHTGSSIIDIDTLYKSGGNIPEEFLKGCGLPNPAIEFVKALKRTVSNYFSCFISHSFKDKEFVRLLYQHMYENLRVYYAPEHIRGAKTIHEQIIEAIQRYDKFILVLSENSMNSNWVKSEILVARKREITEGKKIIVPIRIVEFETIRTWKFFDADEGVDLAREIREYYIPDFSQWKDYDKFNAEFEKLLKALRAEE